MATSGGQITVLACPKCQSSEIHSRMTKTPKYRCNNCKQEFSEALEREPGDIA